MDNAQTGSRPLGPIPRRILLVDDDPTMRQVVSMSLAPDDHHLDFAKDAETALDLFGANSYDLAILDFSLPGLDGLDLARAIRACVRQQPILLVTGNLGMITRSNEALSNANSVLEKPFSVAALRAAVAALFPPA